MPPEERIATFDQDGTLWVEHPMYTQVMYCLDRVPVVAAQKPELEECRAVQDRAVRQPRGDGQALDDTDLEKILAATLTGMTADEFNAEVKKWIATAKHPRWKRPYTELTYQPMLEVMSYLRANGYKTYIVTGGGQDFVRVYSRAGLWHPARAGGRHRGRTQVRLRQGRQADPDQGAQAPAERQQCRQARGHSPDDRPAAVRGVRQLDRRPARCWNTPRLATARGWRCWCCTTTPQREYAYGPAQGLPDTKVGTFTQALYDEAKKNGWTVISMKNDWKRIFAFE